MSIVKRISLVMVFVGFATCSCCIADQTEMALPEFGNHNTQSEHSSSRPFREADKIRNAQIRIRRLLPSLVEMYLSSKDEDVRNAAYGALLTIGLDNAVNSVVLVDKITSALRKESGDVKARALMLLADMGPDAKGAVPVLLRMLRNDTALQFLVVRTLGRIGSAPGVVPELLRLQKSRAPGFVLAEADLALGRLRVQESIPKIREHLTNDDSGLRAHAAKALGFMATIPENVLKQLINACSDNSVEVREEAVRALGNIGKSSKSIIDAIKKGLDDKHENVQKAAIEAVAKMYVVRSDIILQLVKLANSKNFWVALRAEETLRIIGWRNISTLSMLLRKSEVKEHDTITRVLSRTSREGAEVVANLVLTGSPAALSALNGMRGAPEHAEMFEKAVAKGISTPGLTYEALITVGALRLSSRRMILDVIGVLSNAKVDAGVRAEAAEVLGIIGRNSKEARKKLEAATGDKNPNISEAARHALKKLVVVPENSIRN